MNTELGFKTNYARTELFRSSFSPRVGRLWNNLPIDQLNLLPLDFRRQMHDLVLLFKYKTGTVTSNFGRFIHTATRHYRTRNFHQANFDLLFRHNQEYYCNSYFARTVKLWNSLPNILKSSQDLLLFRVHLYEHLREGDIGVCGIAVLANFSCGISVISILNCDIAVFSESAGWGISGVLLNDV